MASSLEIENGNGHADNGLSDQNKFDPANYQVKTDPAQDHKGLELKMNGVLCGVALAALIGIIQGEIIGFSSGLKSGITYGFLVTVILAFAFGGVFGSYNNEFARPHMRSFHFSWFSFHLAFLGWFAFAPLMSTIAPQILEVGCSCADDDTICACLARRKSQIWGANIASVSSTVAMRFLVGPMCDKFGPRVLQSMMMLWGGVMILIAAVAVNDAVSLTIMRFLIGCVGATFVPTQYWNTQLFVKEVAGTAQAIAGGWGNLGGGVTQILMPIIYTGMSSNMSSESAWRTSFVIPGVMLIACGIAMYLFSDDTPRGNINDLVKTGAIEKKSASGSARAGFCLGVTWVLALQYACCFGVELTVNNMMASYFVNRFGQDIVTAGAIAFSFGAMNIFARAVGGLLSDYGQKIMGFRGRLWVQFLCLVWEGVFLLIFSRQDPSGSAIPLLILFSLGVQASEGATFGLVPYVMPKATGAVAGVVGAGGNIGAVSWGMIFLFSGRPAEDCLMIVAIIVLASTALTPFIFVSGQPGMIFSPHLSAVQKEMLANKTHSKVPTTDGNDI
jgi:NNP family nitrate/nitrite transporter-like MFS transporter